MRTYNRCAMLGSPPQVRGKLYHQCPYMSIFRITPAGAGKTRNGTFHQCPNKDHPRRCGENIVMLRTAWTTAGSPPQVRGKLDRCMGAAAARRITPAGAGKTLLFCLRSWRRWDHPRRCGENKTTAPVRAASRGSPPQVRGKLDRCMGAAAARRITPAGAGKTLLFCLRSWRRWDHPRRCGENKTTKSNP